MLNFLSSKQAGFNLVELLVVLAIIGILSTVAVPSYNSFVESGRFSHAYNNLYNAYRFARAEALKTSSPMELTAKTGGWNNGWIVQPAGTSDILLDSPPVKSGVNMAVASTVVIKGRGSVSAAGMTEFKIVGANKTKWLCILQNGQSYQSEGSC